MINLAPTYRFMNKLDYAKTVRLLLDVRGIQQNVLAKYLSTSKQNLSNHLRKNTLTGTQIDMCCEFFGLDIRAITKKHVETGLDLERMIEDESITKPEPKKTITVELSPDDVKQIMLNQAKTIDELREEMRKLMEEFKEMKKAQSDKD